MWTQYQIMQYIEFRKERAEKGDIAESIINNYYKSVKLFCEMNDIILNWKKIAKGKPMAEKQSFSHLAMVISMAVLDLSASIIVVTATLSPALQLAYASQILGNTENLSNNHDGLI
ncbi:MAG: hypothetical protein ACM31H_01500 [Nitrososphaerales archaeon]